MKFIKPLLVKFVMIMAVLWIVLGLFGVSFTDILLTSIVLTGVSYIGDMFILPRVGNITATIADFGLAFVLIWLMGSILYEGPILLGLASLISSIIITGGEFIFHKYLQKQVFTEERVKLEDFGGYRQRNMQTEFGSELNVDPTEEGNSEEQTGRPKY